MLSTTDSRSAVVLYGKIGTLTTAAKYATTGSPRVVTRAAPSIARHVLDAWARQSVVDVFVHSWNPELGAQIDGFYASFLRVSNHSDAQQRLALPRPSRECEKTQLLPRSSRDHMCARTRWALRGMAEALRMRRAWAASRRLSHARVLVMRHDVYFFVDLPLPPLVRGIRLWLPSNCAAAKNRTTHTHTLGAHTRVLANYPACPALPLHASFCDLAVHIDWWFIADEEVADGAIAMDDDFDAYHRGMRHTYNMSTMSSPHFFFGLHVRAARVPSRCACSVHRLQLLVAGSRDGRASSRSRAQFIAHAQLRRRCAIGHTLLAYYHFTLARFVDSASVRQAEDPTQACHAYEARSHARAVAERGSAVGGAAMPAPEPWRPVWWPARGGGGDGACASEAVPGYSLMCPHVGSQVVLRCGVSGIEAVGRVTLWGGRTRGPTDGRSSDSLIEARAHRPLRVPAAGERAPTMADPGAADPTECPSCRQGYPRVRR